MLKRPVLMPLQQVYYFSDSLAEVGTFERGQLRVGPEVIKSKPPTLRSLYFNGGGSAVVLKELKAKS